MAKFQSKQWLYLLPLFLAISSVQGDFIRDYHAEMPKFGSGNGLLTRTIQSQKPTNTPTPKPTPPSEPTESPTESPAPSPSPSFNPTKDPLRDTTAPTTSPTESPAPSPSPSMSPTKIPSESPSDAPSAAPTISPVPSMGPTGTPSIAPSDWPSMEPSMNPTKSSAPSYAPTETPSVAPSDWPSLEPSMNPTKSAQPSASPTTSPSDSPSDSPSASPTDVPSVPPSDVPSMSPTAVTDRTKTAVSTLLLEEIPETMDGLTLAEFELITLDFLKKKILPSDDYVLNTLAVTVLKQEVIYPEPTAAPNSTSNFRDRNLESEVWNVALGVDIRTVGVVTDGRVPSNFNFTEIVLWSFYNHWDQYLWQLGSSSEFFNPLVEVSDWEPQQNKAPVGGKKGKAGYVIGVLFSFVAFGLAVFASYIAIHKHMRKSSPTPKKTKKTRGLLFSPKNSPEHYNNAEVLNYYTHTMSDEKNSPTNNYYDDDLEGGGARAFVRNVNIDIDEHGMESVVLSPRPNFASPKAAVRDGLFVVDEGSDDDKSPLKSPIATSPTAAQNETGTARIGGTIKKWLTPRGIGGNAYASAADSNRRLSSNDPPENQSTVGYNYGKDNIEPDAMKASTKNKAGTFTTDKSTVDGRSKKTIDGGRAKVSGISYNKKSNNDDGQFTLPISFFSNRGPGTDVSSGDSPMSSLADSNASSFFAIGNMNKSFAGHRNSTGAMEDEGYEVSALKMETRNKPASNYDPVVQKEPEPRSIGKEPEQSAPETGDENKPDILSPKMAPVKNDNDDNAVKRAAKRFEQQQQLQPLREIQPPDSTVGVETILGARSRDSQDDEEEDRTSSISASFLQNRSIFSPGKKKDKKKSSSNHSRKMQPSYGYGRVNVEVHEQDAERSVAGRSVTERSVTSHSTLGARPMVKPQEDMRDDKSTLTSVMRRSGCYDVYAPSGPIGIVVDTSKDGPSVHSLKSTSPMLGLITAGDLIVALDGEDTRNMTAAALTRLMARKSRQKERKITLLS